MIRRYATAAGVAASVTFGVLFLMQSLVTHRRSELEKVKSGRIVDFVRLKRESQPEVKKRELPSRQAPQPEPPPPDIDLSNVPEPSTMEIAATMPDFKPQLDIGKGPGDAGSLGGQTDADVVPLVRVSPQYPPRAMERGVEGRVHLSFTVTEAGSVKDVVIVEAQPANYFEQAAVNAVEKYKYRPKVENGKPVERKGVEVILSFRLQK